jgi:spore germination protein GerM
MVDSSGHCPYLGLKQNKAIRFASPTPEHRCYATGQAQEIPTVEPDYQARYCLSSAHTGCPLYTGSGFPSTPDATTTPVRTTSHTPQSGVGGWFANLPLRDRLIYAALIGLLLVIFGIYAVAGIGLLTQNAASPTPTTDAAVAAATTETAAPPAATATPTEPAPTPPDAGTTPAVVGDTTTPGATSTPSPTPVTPSATATTVTATASATPATPTPTPATATTPAGSTQTAVAGVTATITSPTQVRPSATRPAPSATQPAPAPTTPAPSATTAPLVERQTLTLYFADPTDRAFVTVQRVSQVVDRQVATAAINELIAGPNSGGMRRLVPSDVQLLDARIANGRLIADFDRRPAWPGDDRGLLSIGLTLTEFSSVSEVEIQVNGTTLSVIPRQAYNIDNPQGLSEDFSSGSRFLPLYFLNGQGSWVRITRIIPRTNEIANATARELLNGPGSYSDVVYSPIPAGTTLSGNGVRADGSTAIVDLSASLLNASAGNQQAAVDALVLSLTELRTTSGARRFNRVSILVEGRSLGEYWGTAFNGPFTRPPLNPE